MLSTGNNSKASAEQRPNFTALAQNHHTKMETAMIMPYRERFAPWIVVQLSPRMQNVVRGRYRSRSDAEGHLAVLQRQFPKSEFVMMFDARS